MLARFRPTLSATTAALRSVSIRQLSTTRTARSDAIFIHRDTPENNPSIRFEFDAKNLDEAQRIMAKYPPQYKKAAMIPLLHLAQKQNGWTSLPVMNYIAKFLEVPPMRVYEVATFYTMFNRNPV
ncbi:NADH:ubiquinone oxidoreductase 24, partial [Coemansia sp. RSA 454]